MSSEEEEAACIDHARLSRFLSEDCPECGTPGYQRHLSAVGGCRTCMEDNPYPVYTPRRLEPKGWRVKR
jgi:ribosomal protein L37AE/L43A